MSAIPYLSFANNGSPLHFAHANGYPPEAYSSLLRLLEPGCFLHAFKARPLWPGSDPMAVKNWGVFETDLLDFFGQTGLDGWLGAGHSFGGLGTIMAALKEPDLFRGLVAIDPPFFMPGRSIAWNIIFRLGLAYRLHPLTGGALRRRKQFDSREAMFSNYREKVVFRLIDDENLQAYVDSIAVEQPGGGVSLNYSAEWEARIYATGMLRDWSTWRRLSDLKPPLLIIRPEKYATFSDEAVALLKKKLPAAQVITVPKSSHLIPLEKPGELNQIIRQFADAL